MPYFTYQAGNAPARHPHSEYPTETTYILNENYTNLNLQHHEHLPPCPQSQLPHPIHPPRKTHHPTSNVCPIPRSRELSDSVRLMHQLGSIISASLAAPAGVAVAVRMGRSYFRFLVVLIAELLVF